MKEVVRKEVIRLLDARIIYPISDSKWVSPVHCIPKKGGITIKPNENNDLIPHRTIVGYQMCIDYRKLNRATKKENQPLILLDHILEKLSANS